MNRQHTHEVVRDLIAADRELDRVRCQEAARGISPELFDAQATLWSAINKLDPSVLRMGWHEWLLDHGY